MSARTQMEQHYRETCDARDDAATCINTDDQVVAELNATAANLRQQLDQIDAQRHTLAYYLRHLENEHSDYMAEAYTLFCQLYRELAPVTRRLTIHQADKHAMDKQTDMAHHRQFTTKQENYGENEECLTVWGQRGVRQAPSGRGQHFCILQPLGDGQCTAGVAEIRSSLL